jgi:hypothetical protein
MLTFLFILSLRPFSLRSVEKRVVESLCGADLVLKGFEGFILEELGVECRSRSFMHKWLAGEIVIVHILTSTSQASLLLLFHFLDFSEFLVLLLLTFIFHSLLVHSLQVLLKLFQLLEFANCLKSWL